jgi:hypothetical protein
MGLLTFVVGLLYGCFAIQRPPMAERSLKGLIRGDVPLARAIFNDERKRRLIPKLQEEGWPIFDCAGKRSGFPADLAAHARKATRSGPSYKTAARRGGRRRKSAASANATTAA